MRILLSALLVALSFAPPAHASQAEAKDVARNSNCPPGKVETLRATPGMNGETVYKIACAGRKDQFVFVQCRGRTCILLR